MKKISLLFGLALLVSLALAGGLSGQSPIAPGVSAGPKVPNAFKGYAGSASCIECHEKFYKLWSTSFHGLAMQPYRQSWPQRNSPRRPRTSSSARSATAWTSRRRAGT